MICHPGSVQAKGDCTMNRTQQFITQAETFGAHHYHPLPVVIERGEGCWLYDVEGRRYMDMLSAYSAVSFGHCHPRIIAAAQRQMARLTLTSRAFHTDQQGPLEETLATLAGMSRVLLMNSGAEAVETAIKIARKWGYRVKGVPRDNAEIIVCQNNFHGRTTTIISFSTEALYRHDFGPLTPGFKVVPFGDAAALEAAITPDTVAFLVEPIQGEGGVIIPPDNYLRDVRAICDRHEVLLMLDEIQVGLGRTGKLFCFQHYGIEPDALILGKALGGGVFPISAVLSRDGVLSLFKPGEHGSTFGANPLACAIAREALQVLEDENLAARADEMGAYLMQQVAALDSPYVQEIRGKGLLIGVQVKPGLGGARPFCEKLMQEGLLCKETHEDVIRFAPPLVITRDEIDWAMERVRRVLAASLVEVTPGTMQSGWNER
jgi:ornithine--oxo-acid transaminase